MDKNKPKLLVVDDEVEYCSLIQEYFQNTFTVSVAYNGENALRAIAKTQPDCILMDLLMPHLNGLKALQAIKSSTPKIPVIIISASGRLLDVKKCLDLGAFEYILKPVNLDELEIKIKSAIKDSGSSAESVGKNG